SRILGCLRVRDSSLEDGAPLRFSILTASIRPVQVAEFQAAEVGLPGFSEAPAPFTPSQPALRAIPGGARRKTERRRNHLRLVDKD
ncbi:MAG TPA: hypothetical protein VFR34_03425, partial [Paracoccaceae bacterium]|nr:hypothetical protein [Paracoccaceae bacterium]